MLNEVGEIVNSLPINSNFKIATNDLTFSGEINFNVKSDITPRAAVKFTSPGVQDLITLKFKDPLPSLTTSARFKAATGSFTFQKQDSISKSPLAGAVFELYDANNKLLKTITTPTNGIIFETNLLQGNYKLLEKTAPNNYIIDQSTYNFTITAGIDTKVGNNGIIFNTKNIGYFEFKKYENGTTKPLIATFKLETKTGIFIKNITTDANGYYKSSELTPQEYTLTEITQPNGYYLNPTKYDFTIKIQETTKVNSGIIYNDKITDAKIIKKDSKTGVVLENAQFGLYSKMNITGTDVDPKSFMALYTTDKKGEIFIPNLKYQTYYLKELIPPLNYLKPNTSAITLLSFKPGDNTKTYIIKNDEKPTITILKKDFETGKLLENTKFGVYTSVDYK